MTDVLKYLGEENGDAAKNIFFYGFNYSWSGGRLLLGGSRLLLGGRRLIFMFLIREFSLQSLGS
jgi:hypothetical protein